MGIESVLKKHSPCGPHRSPSSNSSSSSSSEGTPNNMSQFTQSELVPKSSNDLRLVASSEDDTNKGKEQEFGDSGQSLSRSLSGASGTSAPVLPRVIPQVSIPQVVPPLNPRSPSSGWFFSFLFCVDISFFFISSLFSFQLVTGAGGLLLRSPSLRSYSRIGSSPSPVVRQPIPLFPLFPSLILPSLPPSTASTSPR